MPVDIIPEPDEQTRLAILAALAEEESEHPAPPAREARLPSRRDGDEDPAG